MNKQKHINVDHISFQNQTKILRNKGKIISLAKASEKKNQTKFITVNLKTTNKIKTKTNTRTCTQ